MTFLIGLVARLGVPERFRRAAAIAATIIAALALLAVLKGCYDRSVIRDHEADREAAADGARETAADERVNDAATDSANERELHHAIDTAPQGGTLSPAAHALACERLRKLGRVPASCRPSGGN